MKDDITRNKDKDVFGDALWSFQKKSSNKEIITWTNLTDEDPVKIKYFFRDYENMPKIEKKALKMCKGKVLDIGCGAGSHGLYIQNNMKMSVIGIDDSKRAVEVSKERGLKKVVLKSIWDYKAEGFDTILLLMNGMGIAKSIDNLSPFLLHLKKKLNHGDKF